MRRSRSVIVSASIWFSAFFDRTVQFQRHARRCCRELATERDLDVRTNTTEPGRALNCSARTSSRSETTYRLSGTYETAAVARRIPSLFIKLRSVLGWTLRMAPAPLGPLITQPVLLSTRRIC